MAEAHDMLRTYALGQVCPYVSDLFIPTYDHMYSILHSLTVPLVH